MRGRGERPPLTAAPPPLARVLILLFGHPRQRECIVGDLDEEYVRRIGEGRDRRAARRWYRRMAVRSVLAGWTAKAGLGPDTASAGYRDERRRAREDVVETLWLDIRHAARSLRRRPIYVGAVALTLALAVGANTAMFSVVHSVLLRPLPFPDPDELYMPWQASTEAPEARGWLSLPNLRDLRERSESFEAIAGWRSATMTLTGMGAAEQVAGVRITDDFFRVFGAEPAIGRAIEPADLEFEGPKAVVLGHGFWRDRFGSDPSVVGEYLELNGDRWQIVGVAPRGFEFPDGRQLYAGDQVDPEGCGRGCQILRATGRLRDGVTPSRARAEARRIGRVMAAEEMAQNDPDFTWHLESLEDYTVGSVRPGLIILLGAVAMVLLIACVNIANLLYANGLRRRGELAVRSALGASRGRIVRTILTEASLLSLLGGGLGLAVGIWTLSGFTALAGDAIPRLGDVGLSTPVLLFGLVLIVDATLLFGLAPAIALTRRSISEMIRGHGRGGSGTGRPGRARSALLAAQVALSLVLLLGTGLLLRSLGELSSVELGFEPDEVETFIVSLPWARYTEPGDAVPFFEELVERAQAIPGVTDAAVGFGVPLGSLDMWGGLEQPDRPEPPPGEGLVTSVRIVSPSYFETMRIPLLRGRLFSGADRAGSQGVAVISESTAERVWPGEDPIGKPLRVSATAGFPEEQRTVVGIVGDVRSDGLDEESPNETYIPHAQSGAHAMRLLLRTRPGVDAVTPAAEAIVRDLDPDLAIVGAATMRELVDEELAMPRFYAVLLGAFAVLAVVLTAIGLYGVVAYQVSMRMREIGIRMAVGAHRGTVVGEMTRQGLAPALAGVGLGLLAAFALSRLIAGLLFGVRPLDPLTWAAVTALVVLIAALASVIPASRASRIEPAAVLRTE